MVNSTFTLIPQYVINITHEMGHGAGFTIVAGSGSGGGGGALSLNELTDVNLNSLADADIMGYDAGSSKFVNYALTTAKVANIDEVALADGAVLLYDGGSSKYKATTTLDNSNTLIQGGTF